MTKRSNMIVICQVLKSQEMRALVIKPGSMHLILDGPKSWEIRRGRCHIRELIGLIESGSGTVVGVAEIDCVGPLTVHCAGDSGEAERSFRRELSMRFKQPHPR